MLNLIPIDVLIVILQHLENGKDIYKFRRVNSDLAKSIFSNQSFLRQCTRKTILSLSDNIDSLVKIDELSKVSTNLLQDILLLLSMANQPKPSAVKKIKDLTTKLTFSSAQLGSIIQVVYLTIVRLNINPLYTSSYDSQNLDEGIFWAQQWHQATNSIDSQLTLAAYWKLRIDTYKTEQKYIDGQTENVENLDCGLMIAQENYDIYIRKAIPAISNDLYKLVQDSEPLLKALANPYTRIICEYIRKYLSYKEFISQGPEQIDWLCSTGLTDKLEESLYKNSHAVINQNLFKY